MTHPLEREFESLCAIIEFMTLSPDESTKKWPAVALMSVIDILDQYWEIIEGDERDQEEDEGELACRIVDSIYESIHSVIVHQELSLEGPEPVSEEQRLADFDQQIAEFRNALEAQAEEQGMKVNIKDLDKKIEQALRDGVGEIEILLDDDGEEI